MLIHVRTHVQPDPSRHNFYNVIHKALRFGHCRMLSALGSLDFSDERGTTLLLAELRGFLALGKGHLDSENREIHAAIEARSPGASDHAAEGHEHHEQSFAELEALIRAVEVATADSRALAGQALYYRFALFAADDIAHMHEEETELLHALQQAFSEEEMRDIERRIVSAIPHDKMMKYLALMMPAINHGERVAMLGGMQKAMPQPVFDGIMSDIVRPALDGGAFAALSAALGLRQAA